MAESGVIGKPDPKRGAIIKAYVVIKNGFEPSDELAEELKQHVRSRLSSIMNGVAASSEAKMYISGDKVSSQLVELVTKSGTLA